MRRLFALAVLMSLAACVGIAQEIDLVNPSAGVEAVSFDGQMLPLAWQASDKRIREYLPEGQKLDSWTSLASIREYPGIDDHRAVVGNLVRQLKQRTPPAPVGLIENPTTGEVIVDFVVWPDDGAFVEFNLFKYGAREEGGIVAQQYALRAYGDKAEEFLRGLKPVRQRLISEMAASGLKPTHAATVDDDP
jgi:hypothetical protein